MLYSRRGSLPLALAKKEPRNVTTECKRVFGGRFIGFAIWIN